MLGNKLTDEELEKVAGGTEVNGYPLYERGDQFVSKYLSSMCIVICNNNGILAGSYNYPVRMFTVSNINEASEEAHLNSDSTMEISQEDLSNGFSYIGKRFNLDRYMSQIC